MQRDPMQENGKANQDRRVYEINTEGIVRQPPRQPILPIEVAPIDGKDEEALFPRRRGLPTGIFRR